MSSHAIWQSINIRVIHKTWSYAGFNLLLTYFYRVTDMQIILSNRITSFSGTIVRGTGYAVRQRNGHFYAYKNSKGYVPPNGHLRFIKACVALCRTSLFFDDIILPPEEFIQAITEAGKLPPKDLYQHSLNADDTHFFIERDCL